MRRERWCLVAMANRGSFVKKGQPLATLDASVEAASLAAARYRSVMQGQVAAAQARTEHGKAKLGWRDPLLQEK